MKFCVFPLLLCFVGFTSMNRIYPPIPVLETEPGIRYLPFEPRPKVKLEVFMELSCPACSYSWPILKQVQQFFTNKRLDLLVQQLPLPYHRNAFLSTQGIYVIQDQTPTHVFNYIEAVLDKWSIFSTDNTVNKTETEVLNDLADIAKQATGIDKNLFINEIGKKRGYTIGTWKYGAKRGVAGTPTYFVNGVQINASPTLFEWITFLNPIINGS